MRYSSRIQIQAPPPPTAGCCTPKHTKTAQELRLHACHALERLCLNWRIRFYLQESRLLRADVVQGDVHVIGVLAHHHGVPLAERASSNVLSADSDIEACNRKDLIISRSMLAATQLD